MTTTAPFSAISTSTETITGGLGSAANRRNAGR